jgi:hypothetical protein
MYVCMHVCTYVFIYMYVICSLITPEQIYEFEQILACTYVETMKRF